MVDSQRFPNTSEINTKKVLAKNKKNTHTARRALESVQHLITDKQDALKPRILLRPASHSKHAFLTISPHYTC